MANFKLAFTANYKLQTGVHSVNDKLQTGVHCKLQTSNWRSLQAANFKLAFTANFKL